MFIKDRRDKLVGYVEILTGKRFAMLKSTLTRKMGGLTVYFILGSLRELSGQSQWHSNFVDEIALLKVQKFVDLSNI